MKVLRQLLELPNAFINRFWFLVRGVQYVEFPRLRGRLVLGGKGKLTLGKGVVINSSHRSNPVGMVGYSSFHVTSGAAISIGNNVGISTTLLYAWTSITIADNVLIGGGCQIFDTDYHAVAYQERILKGDKNVRTLPVSIEEGVFIGTSCIITKGVTIGARSVIAAGSVVVKDVPPGEVWGGNPCRFIKKVPS